MIAGGVIGSMAPLGLAFFDCGGVRLILSRPEKPEFDHLTTRLK
jgi:hypothetical protein